MSIMNTEDKVVPIDPRGGQTSASNAHADLLCEGRHQAQAGMASVTTDDNKFGAEIHDALKNDDPSTLGPEQLSIYESCVEMRERLIMEKFGMDAPNVTRFNEQRFWYRSKDGKLGHSGQADLVVRFGPALLILDYKTLPGEVSESAENHQLRDLVALSCGHLIATEADVAIIQPLVTHSPEVCRYDEAAIAQAQVEMVARITKSNASGAPRSAGEVQCKYCLARFTCKEYSHMASLAVPASMSSLATPVREWSPEQRALFCERLSLAQKWLDECKEEIKAVIAENSDAVPGWKLKPGAVMRPIVKPEELHARFLAASGTTEQFMGVVEISKGNLEAAVRKATNLKGKALKAKMDELLDGLVEENQNAPSLARVT